MKKNYALAILCAFVLIISSASVYAWQTQKETNINADTEVKAEEKDNMAEKGTERDALRGEAAGRLGRRGHP